MLDRSQNDIVKEWMNDAPLASICCITYNHERYISKAIDSFLMQETTFPFEILIHDDASTDGTTDIILAYAEEYPEIIRPIIQTENQFSKGGLINPRFVFPKARGKYIALCEGDDYWTDKAKLQKQVAFLKKNPEYVITYTDCQPFNESGDLNINFGGATRDLESDELMRTTPINTLTACFRNVINEVPLDLMSARLGDQVIWSLLGAHGKGKYLGDIKPARYRVHDEGVHSKQTLKQKIMMQIITYSALFAYYTRIGNQQLSHYFLIMVFKHSIAYLGAKGIAAMAWSVTGKKLSRVLGLAAKNTDQHSADEGK